MILADKIIQLRKKAGWSQEELAAQLSVTRQSISKWEGAQSIPDMDKLLKLSRLFGVSTDYLLKDELEESEPIDSAPETAVRRITLEQASNYLALSRANAPKMALATFLCILSPVLLILLGGISEDARFHISENVAGGIGLCALVLLVAVGVSLFLLCGAKVKEYRFLESEPFETEYGVTGMAQERKREFSERYTRLNIIGVVLCILSVLPLFAVSCFSTGDLLYIGAVCALLVIAGFGCVAFVYGGVIQGAIDKLLEEGDYIRAKKARKKLTGTVSAIYWLVVTAIFLFYTYGASGNAQPKDSWIIWAIAGVLFGAVMAAMKLVGRGKM